jgi:hypothetical protein
VYECVFSKLTARQRPPNGHHRHSAFARAGFWAWIAKAGPPKTAPTKMSAEDASVVDLSGSPPRGVFVSLERYCSGPNSVVLQFLGASNCSHHHPRRKKLLPKVFGRRRCWLGLLLFLLRGGSSVEAPDVWVIFGQRTVSDETLRCAELDRTFIVHVIESLVWPHPF